MRREFRDVHEALDTREDLDEGAERHHLRYLAFDHLALVVGLDHPLPGVRLRLLQAERDALAVAVDVEHLDADLLADLEELGRMVHVAPGGLGGVDEAVDPPEVDEGAEVDVFGDRAGYDVAGGGAVEERL